MALYTAQDPAAADAAFWARFRQLDTDVTRLLRQVADLQQLPQLQFGAPDEGGAAQGGLVRAELNQDLYRTHSGAATLIDEGATVVVHGDQFRGVGFPGDRIDIRKHQGTGKWYAVGSGHLYCTGTLTSRLYLNATAAMDVDGGPTIQVFGKWGGSDSGSKIGVFWNSQLERWDAALETCD